MTQRRRSPSVAQWKHRIARGLWVGQFYKGSDDWCVIVKRREYEGGRRRVFRIGDEQTALGSASDILKDLSASGSERASVAAVLGQYERDHVSTLRLRTEKRYRGNIDNHLIPYFGEKPARDLRKIDFFEYGAAMLAGLEGEALFRRFALVKQSLSTLRGALNWYWSEHELESACPARWISEQTRRLRVRHGIPANRRRPAYTPDELTVLLETARRRFPVLFEIWALAAMTGLRLGEVLGLEWEKVDWLRATVVSEFQIDDRGKPVASRRWAGRGDRAAAASLVLDAARRGGARDGAPALLPGLRGRGSRESRRRVEAGGTRGGERARRGDVSAGGRERATEAGRLRGVVLNLE